ncbi:MAG: S8 family serine peptidase [Acidobacteriia bacterium]|nr:S8 family serine peptidase [Terriglobia bacterium]
MTKPVLVRVLIFLSLGFCSSALCADEPLWQPPPKNDSRVLLLKPKPGVGHADVARQHAARRVKVKHTLPLLGDLQLVELPPDASVEATIAAYRASGQFEYVEPDSVLRIADTVPNDPLYSNLYGMAKIQAPLAWDVQTDAADVVVAVIDTGIDSTHPDLSGNLWTNPVDGSHGFRFQNGVEFVGAEDDNGHGTHVAGTIGAAGNNALGVAGCNWKVQLLAIKFLGSGGSGFTSDAVLGFNKVLELKQAGVNVRVTNNSWGGSGNSQALADAMSACEAAGVLNVCAAGNGGSNIDASPTYPAAYPNRGLLSVGATDRADVAAPYSNRGLGAVDLMAPGVSIDSTVPSGACPLCDPSGYRYLSGTSMAAPHVAGVAAALLHLHPELSAYAARDVLLHFDSYDPVADPVARTTSTGGRLNFHKALTNPYADHPVLNRFPSVNPAADQVVVAGQTVSLNVSGSDPDGDPLRASLVRTADFPHAWLLGRMAELVFPAPSAPSFSFAAPSLSLGTSVRYVRSLADGRGGSDVAENSVTVLASDAAGVPPAITGYSVSPTVAPTGTNVWITLSASDPDGGPLLYSVLYGGTGLCCLYANTTAGVAFSQPGSYRLRSTVMDDQLHAVGSASAVAKVGGATNEPPVCVATLDSESGPAPLTVQYDASRSYDPDGVIKRVAVWSDRWNSVGSWNAPATGTIVYNQPGNYWMTLDVEDNQGARDSAEFFITVLAPATRPESPLIGVAPTTLSQTVSQGQNAAGQVLEVWNAGAGTLGYSISDDAPWLSVAPSTGTSTGEHDPIQVTYGTSRLAPGDYSAVITLTGPASDSPRTVAVYLHVNGALVADAQTVGTLEDRPFAVTLTGSGPGGETLTFNVVTPPAKGVLSGVAPSLTYTPNADANGSDRFTFKVSDGQLESAPATVTVAINAVNDPPTFTLRGASVTARKNAGIQSLAGWVTRIRPGPADEAGQTVSFTASNSNPSLFAVQPAIDGAGTLTFRPAKARTGGATVTVFARDDGGTANGGSDQSASRTFTITVR